MKALLVGLAVSLTVYAGSEIADTTVPQASEVTANIQGRLVSDRAYLETELGATWEDALITAVNGARHNNGQLSVTGTTVRWDNGPDIWCISLPEPDSLVSPVRCS